jgi:endonuclease/exonuclease/phosphatase (EEP) superfamily protein YafD
MHPWLDVPSHLAPVWFGAGLLLATTALFARRSITTGLGLAAALSAGLLMAPEHQRPEPPTLAAPTAGAIKVIQLNAYRRNTDEARVLEWVLREAPDILTVAEASRSLRDALRRRGWRTAGAHGPLVIFTRERYLYMSRPKLPAGAELTFVNATYRTSSGPVEVFTTHLEWPTSRNHQSQLADLRKVTAARRSDRMILTGDFNTTPWSEAMRTLDRDLGLARRDRALPTWPARVLGKRWPWPILPIDHVYAGPGWRTLSVTRGPYVGSDHYPIVVVLAPTGP